MCECVCVCVLSHVQLFVTQWTIACQAPLSMQFSRLQWVAISYSRGSSSPASLEAYIYVCVCLFTFQRNDANFRFSNFFNCIFRLSWCF